MATFEISLAKAGHERVQRIRVAPLAVAILALWAGLWTGLFRVGWQLGPFGGASPFDHGALMVGGFVGTLISLERAVAAGKSWTFAAPWLSGIGAMLLLAGLPSTYGAVAITLASALVVVVFIRFLQVQWSDFTLTMALGAGCWLVGNIAWLWGMPIGQIVPWWAAFLILTIAGERLELSRLAPRSQAAQRAFWGIVAVYLSGLVIGLWGFDLGTRWIGVTLLLLAAWLFRYDVARRLLRASGLPRYAAISVLSGYVWLAASGVFAVVWGAQHAGFRYDAIIHTQFLGFVFVMIMAHAPIIFPAVLGVTIEFGRRFYVPLVLLHASLAIRIVADILGWWTGRQWAGTVNVGVVLLFFVVVVRSIWLGRRTAADKGGSAHAEA